MGDIEDIKGYLQKLAVVGAVFFAANAGSNVQAAQPVESYDEFTPSTPTTEVQYVQPTTNNFSAVFSELENLWDDKVEPEKTEPDNLKPLSESQHLYSDITIPDEDEIARKNGLRWTVGMQQGEHTAMQANSDDYLSDMRVCIDVPSEKKTLLRPLHEMVDTLPEDFKRYKKPVQAVAQQWDKLAENPETNLLLHNMRQAGIVFYVTEGFCQFGYNLGATRLPKTANGMIGADRSLFTYKESEDGPEKKTQYMRGLLGVSEYAIHPLIRTEEYIIENMHTQTTLAHEATHAADYGFSASSLFSACYGLDKGRDDNSRIVDRIEREKWGYPLSMWDAERLPRLMEERVRDPETFKTQFPMMESFFSNVFFPSLEVQNIAYQLNNEAGKAAIEAAHDFPSGLTFKDALAGITNPFGNDRAERLQQEMTAFGKKMADLRDNLIETHKTHMMEGQEGSLSVAQLREMSQQLNNTTDMQARMDILNRLPDLKLNPHPDKHFSQGVIELTQDSNMQSRAWWTELCQEAFRSGKESPQLQTIKGMADKGYIPAMWFMGDYAQKRMHNTKVATQYMRGICESPLDLPEYKARAQECMSSYEMSVYALLESAGLGDSIQKEDTQISGKGSQQAEVVKAKDKAVSGNPFEVETPKPDKTAQATTQFTQNAASGLVLSR